jgi:uncharacterized lipoprotein YajG
MERSRFRWATLLALVILMAAVTLLDGCKKQSGSSQQTQPKKATQKQLDKAVDDM